VEKNIIFNVIFLKNNRFSLKKKFDLAEKKFYILIKILLILFFSWAWVSWASWARKSSAMATSWGLCRSRKTKKVQLGQVTFIESRFTGSSTEYTSARAYKSFN